MQLTVKPVLGFVAVLSASNYMYAEAFRSGELPHRISGHVHAFEFFGDSGAVSAAPARATPLRPIALMVGPISG